jgi:hypothetical protein
MSVYTHSVQDQKARGSPPPLSPAVCIPEQSTGVPHLYSAILTASLCDRDTQAARIDGRLDKLHYNIACFHASRGDAVAASQELRLAVEHGYRDVTALLRDPEVLPVLNHPDIQQVVSEIRHLLAD